MINHLMYMDDIKLSGKTEKELETNTRGVNIQSGHRDVIWHRKMYHARNEKRPTIPDGRNGTAKSRQD